MNELSVDRRAGWPGFTVYGKFSLKDDRERRRTGYRSEIFTVVRSWFYVRRRTTDYSENSEY
jgi:hypothetical protein